MLGFIPMWFQLKKASTNYLFMKKGFSILKNSYSLKRESPVGRGMPVGFYSANILTWFIIGIVAGDWDLLVLVLLPLPALILYLICTRRKIQ